MSFLLDTQRASSKSLPVVTTRSDGSSNSLRVAFQISGLLVAVGMKHTKNSQIWVLLGPSIVMLGQGLMIDLVDMGNGQHGNEASFIASKVISGIGRALFQTAAQVSVQAVVSRQEVVIVTGIFQASNSVGGAIGTRYACPAEFIANKFSIAGAIWRNTLPSKLSTYLPDEDKSKALHIFQSIVSAQEYSPGTPAREAINRDYSELQRILAIVATGLCVPSLIFMWFMKNIKLDQEDLKDEQGVDHIITKMGRERRLVAWWCLGTREQALSLA